MKKTMMLRLILLLLVVAISIIPNGRPQGVSAQTANDFVPGELIVGLKQNMMTVQAQSALPPVLSVIKGKIKKSYELSSNNVATSSAGSVIPGYQPLQMATQVCLVELDDKSPEGMSNAIAELKSSESVKFAEPNYLARIPEAAGSTKATGNAPTVVANRHTSDALLPEQWGYQDIQADWTPEFPRTAPVIAIIDTGVDYTHADLAGRVIKGPDVVNGDSDPMDDNGHGTHNAGTAVAVANNYIGITGVSPTSRIYAIKALDSQGIGTYYDIAYSIWLAAIRSDVRVISLSLTGTAPDQNLEDMVNFAWNRGKIVVAAAGNGSTNTPNYPAYYENCIAVTANGYNDGSNFYPDARAIWGAAGGNYGDWVDISAPGTSIISTVNYGTGYDSWSGTSMATPMVAGAAARVLANNPRWTNAQVRTQLESVETTDWNPLDMSEQLNWPEGECPFGRLNLFKALGGNAVGKGIIQATILDGVTGKALAGATMRVMKGSRNVGTDTAPVWGDVFMLLDPGTYTVVFSRTGYSSATLRNVVVGSGETVNLEFVPLAPGSAWTLIITWDPNSLRSAELGVPAYGRQPGTMIPYGPVVVDNVFIGYSTAYPYARFNHSATVEAPLDSISIAKQLSATSPYLFFGLNLAGNGFDGATAWVYRGRLLVDVIQAPSGFDTDEWDIGTIYRGRWTRINSAGSASANGYRNSGSFDTYPSGDVISGTVILPAR